MIEFLIIPFMAITSGWAGGSLWGHKMFGRLDFLPEVLFALGIMWAVEGEWGGLAGLAMLWAYIWMQTGHANALPWGDGGHNPERENTLDPLVKWLCDKLKIAYFSKNYARLFMAVKGFLITLPVGGTGFLFWPLGYEIGHRAKNHLVSELCAGAGVGISILIYRSLT